MEIISYPRLVPGLDPQHFSLRSSFPTVPARNRRIGEFLKELGLAEARLTGLRKVAAAMAANGSPAPRYDFDEQRTYFRATLPAHAEYTVLSAVRDAAELIRLHAGRGDLERAERVLAEFEEHATPDAMREAAEVLASVRRNT